MSMPCGGVAAHGQLGDAARLVGRVVQDLDLEQLARVVDPADRVDQPVGDVHLVVDRQLDRDDRQRRRAAAPARGSLSLLLHVQIDEVVPVPAVDGENDQDEEIRDENQRFSGRHRLGESVTGTIDHIICRRTRSQRTSAQHEPLRASSAARARSRRRARHRRPRSDQLLRCAARTRRSRTWASPASITIAPSGRAFRKSSSA